MNFCENLQFLRKKKEMSQEQLAEKLEISRQAISKWESGTSYPEMDKLLQLCDLFQCTLDDLVTGTISVEESSSIDKKEYEKHYHRFSIAMSFGVSIVVFAIAVYFILIDQVGKIAKFPVMISLGIGLISIFIFLYYGMEHDSFLKEKIEKEFYISKETKRFNQKFALGISFAIGILSFGLINLIYITGMNFFGIGIFLLFLTVSLYLFVYYGIQKSKYDMVEFPKNREKESLSNRLSGVIAMIAVIVFLYLGLVQQLWHPAWIVFPIAGILCGIICTILGEE